MRSFQVIALLAFRLTSRFCDSGERALAECRQVARECHRSDTEWRVDLILKILHWLAETLMDVAWSGSSPFDQVNEASAQELLSRD